MFNALKIPVISRLVQVGVRDYCLAERNFIEDSDGRIKTFFDKDIKEALYEGVTWKKICKKIIKNLPKKVYISFDIDGLDPKLCPNTGTPVAGGFELSQIFYLLTLLYKSGRQIIGFDLNEVGDAEWDANVGARVLYKLAALQISTAPPVISF
jgi:agmatinase